MNEIDYEIEEEDDQEGRAGRRRRKTPASPKSVEPKSEKPKRKETDRTPTSVPEAKRQRRRGRTKEEDDNSVDEDEDVEAVASDDEAAPSTPLKAATPKPSVVEPPKKEEPPKPAATTTATAASPSPAAPKVTYQRVTAPPVRATPDPAAYITTPKPTPVAAKPKATKTITNISQHVAPEADTFAITINPDNKSIIIPPQSSWFSMGQIHPLEQRAVPEFFQGLGSKTPDLYKDYRDFMIMAYNQNPGQYLTLTACRRNLAGDVGSILRVHTFLEHWGLINNGIQPISRVLPLPPLQEVRQKPITLDDILLVKPTTPNLATHSIKLPVPVPPPSKSVYCDHCKAECTDYSYESDRIPGHKVVLCVTCYHGGHYDSTLSAADFFRTRRDSFVAVEWTEAETLRLLDGLEQFQEDWNSVAQHVGTKTPEQCLQHFLSMPIEDPYFKPSVPSGPLEAEEVAASIDVALKSGNLPFNTAPNPVLALLSFLAHGTTPQIASAAAKAALHAYKEDVDQKVLASQTDRLQAAELAQQDRMDVDGEEPVVKGDMHVAAAAALGGAAAKARELAKAEEMKIQYLVAELVEIQMKKIDAKLAAFEEFEAKLRKSRDDLDAQTAKYTEDRAALAKSKADWEATHQAASMVDLTAVPPVVAAAPAQQPPQ